MNNALDGTWWSEPCEAAGSAFSLKVKSRLHAEQTAFQHIEVYETETFGNLMVIDGFVMLTSRDNFLYHEMMAHPALFTHPAPKRVLIIGGGDCGTLREVLRHPVVERAQQVDIDEGVTRAAERFFPELCESNGDPRAELHFADGIRWVKEAAAGSVDLIIVDSTDPIGPAEGLFNEAFYADCHRALGEQGILVQQSESPLYHMRLLTQMHTSMRRTGFDDVRTLQFPQPVYPSGWWSATLAGKGGLLENFREVEARNKAFPTRYYSADMHRAAFVLPPFMAEAFAAIR